MSGERGSTSFIFSEAWTRLSSLMVLFGFPVSRFHNTSCLLPAALLSSLVVAVVENVLGLFERHRPSVCLGAEHASFHLSASYSDPPKNAL